MKSVTNLILSLLTLGLLATILVSCDKDESRGGAELSALSYATGEVALGNTDYVSAAPTIFLTSAATFSISKVTLNGQVIANTSPEIMTINENSGVITARIKATADYVGEYLVSVRVKNSSSNVNFDNTFRLVVKGIEFESDITLAKGESVKVSPKKIYLAQGSGTLYYLALPKGATASDYTGITVDSLTCAVNVASTTEAGIYPISISVKNLTNTSTTLANVVNVAVQSKPYDLVYTPATITLITSEGHVSPAPKVRAASAADGSKVSYALVDSPSDQFSIDPTTGVITLPEDNTLPAVLKTYNLSVKVSNSIGQSTFTNAYSVVLDPNKEIDPISAVVYSDTFPVDLKPGQPWTSSRPVATGSSVGIAYSLVGAPAGVTINAKTGIITMAAGHKMPLELTNNNITVSVKNSGMSTGKQVVLGNFAINPMLWAVTFKTNSKDDALVNSGLANMDRYSFVGKMLQPNATSIQVKNGWAINSNRTMINGLNCSTAEATAGSTLQWNNDWLVSDEIEIGSFALNPSLMFKFAAQYGGNDANIPGTQVFNAYILEMTDSKPYVKGNENQDGTTLDLTKQPSNLNWGTPVWTSTVEEGGKVGAPTLAKTFSLAAYKGKKIRVAFQFYNVAQATYNTRSYCIDKLRVEESLVP